MFYIKKPCPNGGVFICQLIAKIVNDLNFWIKLA